MSSKKLGNLLEKYTNGQTRYYMCKIDYDYELRNIETRIYPSVKALKEKHGCVDECGIVEVEIRVVNIVEARN